MDTSYNRFPLNKNIVRAYDWNEVLEIITEISETKQVI